MKKILTLIISLSLIYCIFSCEKHDEKRDFYEPNYRAGLWISTDKKDTLDFVDNEKLIRKGDFYKYEEYLYRIEGENLFIRLPNSSLETQHSIMVIDENSVVLGDMYISVGFTDNSGTFTKETNQ